MSSCFVESYADLSCRFFPLHIPLIMFLSTPIIAFDNRVERVARWGRLGHLGGGWLLVL